MGQLFTNNKGKCERYDEQGTFNHYIGSNYFLNQNPNDFGFLYYHKSNNYNKIVETLIYDFDKYSYYHGRAGIIDYLCDDYGNQYDFSSGSYRSVGSNKLIHESDYKSINLNPTSSASVSAINNNCGNWPKTGGDTDSWGGGVNLNYKPTSSDYIYIYLTNGPLYSTNDFDHYDMTDPYVLGGDPGNSVALRNNILRVYSTGNTNNYRNTNGSVSIHIPFNCIGRSSDSGSYSIFYGVNTWLYLYSSAYNFQGKQARVITFNNKAPGGSTDHYSFGAMTNNIGNNVIGFPIFENVGAGAYRVNYYLINVY